MSRENMLELHVFFGELGYTKITQKPDYPSSTLFGKYNKISRLSSFLISSYFIQFEDQNLWVVHIIVLIGYDFWNVWFGLV